MSIAEASSSSLKKTPITIDGAHGLGDNLHQRGCVRQLMRDHEVWLYSSWVSVYHDLIADGLHVINKRSPLRTQSKNAKREEHLFETVQCGPVRSTPLPYRPEAVRRYNSVLAAMCEIWGVSYADADFRIPIPEEWADAVPKYAFGNGKPLLVYRPPTIRTEWRGSAARNPDPVAYAELYRSIRDQFFVVSVADLLPNYEWIAGDEMPADVKFHKGELAFEQLAALFHLADMVLCAPGFAVVLAQAVSTPVVAVFGGYEDSRSFSGGARYTPYLGIDPITPCRCFSHYHSCQKQIDIPAAKEKLNRFIVDNVAAV